MILSEHLPFSLYKSLSLSLSLSTHLSKDIFSQGRRQTQFHGCRLTQTISLFFSLSFPLLFLSLLYLPQSLSVSLSFYLLFSLSLILSLSSLLYLSFSLFLYLSIPLPLAYLWPFLSLFFLQKSLVLLLTLATSWSEFHIKNVLFF